MKKPFGYFIIAIYILLGYQQYAYSSTYDYIITFFIREYPHPIQLDDGSWLMQSAAIPGKMSCDMINALCKHHSPNVGIVATYFGFTAVSDNHGQITFPRAVQKAYFKLLITEKLRPILMIGNTIHHWELDSRVPAKMYITELLQDHQTKLWYWKVQETPLPSNKIIDSSTITILAKPDAIFVPAGITLTNKNPNLILPPIYAKEGFTNHMNVLNFLNVRAFFAPLHYLYKKQTDTYYSTLTSTS